MKILTTLRPRTLSSKQSGVVLFLALIVLVAMTMAGIAMVRSVDTSNLIAGNMSFQQGAVQEADLGIEAAMVKLPGITNRAANIAPHYYAVMQSTATTPALGSNGAPSYINNMSRTDPKSTADVHATSDGFSALGNRVRIVIERMCNTFDPGTGVQTIPSTDAEVKANCLTVDFNALDTSSMDHLKVKLNPVMTGNVYYRVTTRVDGPKNTVSMTQAILRF